MALVALCAEAIAPAGASAAAEINSESYPTILDGEQTNVQRFTFDPGSTAGCNTAIWQGFLTGPTSELDGVIPVYEECTAFKFNATVDREECTFAFEDTTVIPASMVHEGTMDIFCPVGQSIKVIGGNCEVQIPTQTGLGPIQFEERTNTPTAKNDLRINFNITGALTYKKIKDGFLCPLFGVGEAHTGNFVGQTTVDGFNVKATTVHELGVT